MIQRYFLVMIAAAGLVACGAAGGGAKLSHGNLPQDEMVALRAVDRWQKVIAADWQAAYQFLTPGARRIQSYEDYAQRMGQAQIKWMDARVIKVVCEDAETCHVQVELDIEVNVPGMGTSKVSTLTVIEESWLSSDGGWFYLPSQAR